MRKPPRFKAALDEAAHAARYIGARLLTDPTELQTVSPAEVQHTVDALNAAALALLSHGTARSNNTLNTERA